MRSSIRKCCQTVIKSDRKSLDECLKGGLSVQLLFTGGKKN